jgi:two-component system KDP operon response regulator KdpE
MSESGLRVLVVDDEQAIRRYLRATLGAQGYHVSEAASGNEALFAVKMERPDLLILDLGLPDVDGIEVTRQLREWTQIPILILSVREHESDKIAALDAGADDYLTKPFGTGELMARLRAAMRRTGPPDSSSVFQVDELRMDTGLRQVSVGDRKVTLTPTEYDLLKVMLQNAGRVLTHRQLLSQVWGPEYTQEAHLLRANISNLRHKIEPDPARPHYILTEPGVGYRLRVTN